MSAQAEEGVILAILEDASKAKHCDLSPEEFQVWHWREIYHACKSIAADNGIPDIVTIAEKLHAKGQWDGMGDALKRLYESGIGAAAYDDYVKIIRRDYRISQAVRIADGLTESLRASRDLDAIDKAIQGLMSITRVGRSHEYSMQQALSNAVKLVEQAHEADGLVGLSTGLRDLDDSIGGLHKTDLIVIGARPALGKTALMLNLAYSAKVPVGIISAEQGNEQIALRMISIHGRIDSQKIRNASFTESEWPQFSATVQSLKDYPIWICDAPGININQVCRQAREWKQRYDIGALYVDYIQKVRGSMSGQKKLEQVTEVTETLKDLAKELDIPVVALAQVNREVDKRANPRPLNGDLSDASAIEKEADIIMFLYRDEVYHPGENVGTAEIDISKNRHGPVGVVTAQYSGPFMRFENLVRRYSDAEVIQ